MLPHHLWVAAVGWKELHTAHDSTAHADEHACDELSAARQMAVVSRVERAGVNGRWYVYVCMLDVLRAYLHTQMLPNIASCRW